MGTNMMHKMTQIEEGMETVAFAFPVFRPGNLGFSEGRDRDGCLTVYKKPEIDKSTIGRSKQNVFF